MGTFRFAVPFIALVSSLAAFAEEERTTVQVDDGFFMVTQSFRNLRAQKPTMTVRSDTQFFRTLERDGVTPALLRSLPWSIRNLIRAQFDEAVALYRDLIFAVGRCADEGKVAGSNGLECSGKAAGKLSEVMHASVLQSARGMGGLPVTDLFSMRATLGRVDDHQFANNTFLGQLGIYFFRCNRNTILPGKTCTLGLFETKQAAELVSQSAFPPSGIGTMDSEDSDAGAYSDAFVKPPLPREPEPSIIIEVPKAERPSGIEAR